MNGSRTRRPRTTVAIPLSTATTARTTATTVGSGPPDSGSDRLPSSVSAPSPPTSIAENRIAPTMSRRPARRGVSQPLLAAQATTSAAMPIGTLT